TTWLEEEISYLSKRIRVESGQPDLFSSRSRSNVKIETALSVAQLAYLFKLLSDVGVISHRNQSDVIRLLADNFQTSKCKDISLDSLRNKFYDADPYTL